MDPCFQYPHVSLSNSQTNILSHSQGFLLGLSVIGLMSIVGNCWAKIIHPTIKSSLSRKDASSVCNSTIIVSDSKKKSADVKDDFVKKCNDWNCRNDELARDI